MNQILRLFFVLLIACELPSCVVADVDPVVGGWEGSAAPVVVGGATIGMAGYYGRPYYGGSYYRRPYARAGYVGRSVARGYHRPYVGARPGRF
jgi:hypothetical protein